MFSTKVIHVFAKTHTCFYRITRHHNENFPHQSRVSLRLYQNSSPNSVVLTFYLKRKIKDLTYQQAIIIYFW